MNEFKTGDVVVHPEYGRGIVQDVGWVEFAVSNDDAVLRDVADDLRRLVVIDPEDPEQVERLAEAHQSAVSTARWDALYPNVRRDLIDAMKTALREFANPKPTKPEELAAVLAEHSEVYDSDCGLYFGCTCGWDNDTDEDNTGYPEHVAAVLLASPAIESALSPEAVPDDRPYDW